MTNFGKAGRPKWIIRIKDVPDGGLRQRGSISVISYYDDKETAWTEGAGALGKSKATTEIFPYPTASYE